VPAEPNPAVSAAAVLRALSEVRRRGAWPLIQELDGTEPDLANFLMEELSAIHHTIAKTPAGPKTIRRLQRQVQDLVVVCVLALRDPRGGGDEPPTSPQTETEQA